MNSYHKTHLISSEDNLEQPNFSILSMYYPNVISVSSSQVISLSLVMQDALLACPLQPVLHVSLDLHLTVNLLVCVATLYVNLVLQQILQFALPQSMDSIWITVFLKNVTLIVLNVLLKALINVQFANRALILINHRPELVNYVLKIVFLVQMQWDVILADLVSCTILFLKSVLNVFQDALLADMTKFTNAVNVMLVMKLL